MSTVLPPAAVPSLGSGPRRPPGPPDTWDVDPIQLALDGSATVRGHGLPEPFCVDTGRRVLRAVLEFPTWVLRRVESVSFEEGRSVLRTMAIQFKVRDDAPVFRSPAVGDEKPKEYWLVPLAIMNRRTLVEFHLCDEDGKPLTMPGLRLAQRLDEAVLLAAAAASGRVTPRVREFAQDVVAGRRSQVHEAMEDFEDGRRGTELAALRDDPLFRMALARWRYNFTLYVFLPVTESRDKLLSMSFVEPVDWRYHRTVLGRQDDGSWTYRPLQPARFSLSHLASALGWTPTGIRFQTPSAENAASYHFEVAAPKGVRIAEATLLAGRPHVRERPSVDHVRADSLTIGLHAVEVPPNSLCRAQVHLRVQRAGWLTTLLVTTLAITAVLGTVAVHAWRQEAPDPDQDTNVIVLLITAAAAAATFIAQRDFPGVAARLVTRLRALGVLVVALPVVAAGFLSFKDAEPPLPQWAQVPEPAEVGTQWGIGSLTVVGLLLSLVVGVTYLRTWRDELRRAESSPWDMTVQTERDRKRPRRRWYGRRVPREEEFTGDYEDALARFGFRAPAVGVLSSEGWHSTYCWTDDHHQAALEALRRLESGESPGRYACAAPGECPHSEVDRCTVRARASAASGNGGRPPT